MTLQRTLVLALAFVIGGCGSGGGGGDGDDSTGGGGTNPPNPPTSNGSAEIIFPWAQGAATAPTVMVRGTAADPEGVATVTVNGVDAAVAAAASTAGLLAKVSATVEWSAEVDLAQGENELVVSVKDDSGDVTENVDSATVNYVEVPVTFTLDTAKGRVVGLSYTLTSESYVQHLVQHDYVADEQTVFDTVWTAPSTTCFRAVEEDFLFLSLPTDNDWQLRSYNLANRTESLVAHLPEAALDPGPGFDPDPIVLEMDCDSAHTSAYVLVNYVDENGGGHSGSGFAKSRVLDIELAAGNVKMLAETNLLESPRWIPGSMGLAADSLVTMREFNLQWPLTSVSLADGSRSDLTPGLNVGGVVFAPALDAGRVYVATMEGVDEVDLSGPVPVKKNISVVDPNDPLTFAQPRAIAFDPVNNRVLVGDSALDTVIAIDLATGDRSEFLSRKIGQGTALITPRRFAISSDGALAYVGDDGDNAPARLFEIDLATGDRRVIGDISQAVTFRVTGVALDEAAGVVYVAGPDVIVAVDLESEALETIADTNAPVLEAISDIAIDSANGRLLVGDFANDAIYALDLVTRDIDVVSQAATAGDGPPFGGVVSLTQSLPGELFVAGQASGVVTRVDLATGDREPLAHGCDLGLASTFAGLDQVLYNPLAGELIIKGDTLYSFDTAALQCTKLPSRVVPLEFRVTPANQLLAVDFGSLLQIDRDTGEVVIISK